MTEQIQKKLVENELRDAYLDYAMSVITARALPDVHDGLKPVHRRILFSMHELGVQHNKQTKKSARIVGECFVKDTLVLTEKGLIPIQKIKRGDKVYTQDGIEKVNELYVMPEKDLLNLTLENGINSKITPLQKFKVLNENWEFSWKEAKDLKKEDFIIVKSGYPNINKKLNIAGKDLNENISYLLGLLLSDGWVEKSGRLCFYNTHLPIIKKIETILRKEFDYSATIEELNYEVKSTSGQLLLNTGFQIRINRKVINDYFVNNFNLAGIKSDTKIIPLQIMQSPKEVIFSFVSGLMDGDGSVHKSRNVIQYATVSKRLAQSLVILLQHFDIHGTIYTNAKCRIGGIINDRPIKSNKPSISIEFKGDSAQRLGKELNLMHEENSKKLNILINQNIGKSNYEVLPYGSIKLFQELSKNHLGGGWYKDDNGNKFRAGIKYPSKTKIRYSKDLHSKPLRISQIIEWGIQDKLKKIGSELFEFLNSVINNKLYFVKVKSIEKCEKEVTYDIQVENKHEFIANSMIAHNCMGKYHPHGDMSIYDALARMAQEFSLRYPLVIGQGNWGSVDGDPPAAQRYTEAKLSKLADKMLEDIEKNTVNFTPNFDNSMKEPIVLPSKVPNLLLNGTSGIAVGMTSNIPPHNMNEVCDGIIAMIEDPEINSEELMKYVKGPDFPTGGIILGRYGIQLAYSKGKGKITVRAKCSIEKNRIIVSEIPYQVNKSMLLEGMAELVHNKTIEGISDIRDESNKKGIRVVIELKNNANADLILNQLYKHTQLQTTFGIIMLALVAGQPKRMNLRDIIYYYIAHRKRIITRRTQFELDKATDRAHILEGLLIALKDIDAIIKGIKASKSVEIAKKFLMDNYTLSDKQAVAILEMRLQRLTALEQDKIKDEHASLLLLIEELKGILASQEKILNIIKQEITELKNEFGDERRTEILDISDEEVEDEDLIKKEDVIITLTHAGYVKSNSLEEYHSQRRGGTGIISTKTKEEDFVENLFVANTHSYLLCFTNLGKLHAIKGYQVPRESRYAKGIPIVNLMQLEKDEKVTTVLPVTGFSSNINLMFCTKKGLVKKTPLEAFAKPRKGGVLAIKLKDNDELVIVKLSNGNFEFLIASKKGQAVRFSEKDVRVMGRNSSGVRGIRLVNDIVIGMEIAKPDSNILTVTEKGFGKRTEISEYRFTRRGGKGVRNIKVTSKNGNVVGIKTVMETDEMMFMTENGITIRTPVSGISSIGRNTQGVRLIKLKEDDKVSSLARISASLIENKD